MIEYSLREYRACDVPQLKGLWQRVFGDGESLIDSFFSFLLDMGTAIVAAEGEKVFGAAYVLTGFELIDGVKKPPVCGYIYAVAVEKESRGAGAGKALVLAAAEKARRRGAEIVCTLPAEPSLYGWYKDILGLECALYRERRSAKSCPDAVMRLSSTEYMLWRERILREHPHIHPSNPTLEFAKCFYEELGGGFFACASGICAAYVENNVTVIKELVAMDKEETELIAAAVGAELGTKTVDYYLPSLTGEPYIAAIPGQLPAKCVWNLSFD